MTSLIALSTSICVVTSRAVVGSFQHQQPGPAGHGHGHHDALLLAAGGLVRIAMGERFRMRQVEQVQQLDGAPSGGGAVGDVVEGEALDDLVADGDGRVERGLGALRHIGHIPGRECRAARASTWPECHGRPERRGRCGSGCPGAHSPALRAPRWSCRRPIRRSAPPPRRGGPRRCIGGRSRSRRRRAGGPRR